MTKFVAYIRCSTDRQGRSGLGLEAQIALIERHVAQDGGQLIDTVMEVESGSLNERPGLQRSLALCRRHRAILIIGRLDRHGRRLSFLATLLEADVEVRVADMPGASKLTLQLMSVIAEAERDMIRDRTRQALAAAKARGTILGKHGRLLGQQALEAARALYSEYGPSIRASIAVGANLREIAAGLNARGVPTREPGSWGPANTSRLLKRLNLGVGTVSAYRSGSGSPRVPTYGLSQHLS
jgi:DNA invertase Pin-like site-specific DNA recombinase